MELKIVRELIDRLNKENIIYCHWKSNQHVGDAFTGVDDIDMLISQNDILNLNKILSDLGYKRFKLPEKRSYPGIEDYLCLDTEKGVFVHLHLHYQLTLGEKFLKGYQLPYAVEILDRRIYDNDNGIYITSHEDEMWLLLIRLALKIRNRDNIKLLLNKRIFGDSTLNEFKWLQKRIDFLKFESILDNLFDNEIKSLMVSICKSDLQINKIKTLRNLIRNKLKPFKTYSSTKSHFKRWSRELFRVGQIVNNKIFKRPTSYRRTPISGGKVITFLGPDGAGKSTIIKEIHKKLQSVMDVRSFYLGSGDGECSLLRKPLKYLYKLLLKRGTLDRKSKRFGQDGRINRVGEKSVAKFIRKLGEIPWTFTLSKERLTKIIRSRKFRNNGYIVLTDRYPQSQVIDICDGPKFYLNPNLLESNINKLLSKYEKKCFEIANQIKPDVIIILKVSSDVAYKRKQEEVDLYTHNQMMNTILNLDFGNNTQRIVIDADQSLNKVIVDVLCALWRCL